jgi:hypothetical protein
MVVIAGDTGIVIQVTVGIDLTGALTTELHVRRPDGLEVQWTAAVVDPANGILQYQTGVGDLDIAGLYALHAYIVDVSSFIHTGEVVTFLVASPYSPVCEEDMDPGVC